jgi:hypothetical protein
MCTKLAERKQLLLGAGGVVHMKSASVRNLTDLSRRQGIYLFRLPNNAGAIFRRRQLPQVTGSLLGVPEEPQSGPTGPSYRCHVLGIARLESDCQ